MARCCSCVDVRRRRQAHRQHAVGMPVAGSAARCGTRHRGRARRSPTARARTARTLPGSGRARRLRAERGPRGVGIGRLRAAGTGPCRRSRAGASSGSPARRSSPAPDPVRSRVSTAANSGVVRPHSRNRVFSASRSCATASACGVGKTATCSASQCAVSAGTFSKSNVTTSTCAANASSAA